MTAPTQGEREALERRLAEIEAEMGRSDPRFVSDSVREIVQLARRVLSMQEEAGITDPVDWPIVHADSYSDGMYGWVEMLDRKNGNKQRVSWSVTGKFQTQSAAMDEARRLLRNKR